ncbi:MAG: cobalt ECF transporter T component CbiQ, partial [Deltaproteobacteria bacterium]
MISEHLSEGSSYLHDFDPRFKIIVALIYSVTVALLTSFPLLLLSLFYSFILVFWARLPSRTVFKRLLVVNGFVIFLWFILPFSYDGKELISLGPLVATDVGVYQVLKITIKSNAIIMCLMALLSTSPTFMLVHALHHLKVPSKLVHLFFFTYRYIHVIYT